MGMFLDSIEGSRPISSPYTAPNQSVLYQPDQSISIRKPMFEHRLRAPNLVPFRVRKQLL